MYPVTCVTDVSGSDPPPTAVNTGQVSPEEQAAKEFFYKNHSF
jgi:predicted secreted protein